MLYDDDNRPNKASLRAVHRNAFNASPLLLICRDEDEARASCLRFQRLDLTFEFTEIDLCHGR